MRQKSLLKNVIYNIVKTFSSLVFPVITFAYASRILGDLGIGKVSFAKSVVSYFVMLAMLGMNYYGTREAARLREDRQALSQFTREMLTINLCTTILSCALAATCFLSVPRFKAYGSVFIICALAIPLQGLGMEWFYQAIEEYRYITVRTMAFQAIALVAMFFFVRKSQDVAAYAAVTLIASSGSYILNFINVRKYINFGAHGRLEIKRHIKPLLWLFAQVVSIELYTVLDSTMLGFIQGDAAVGRYTAAVKIHRMVNSLIAAVGVVLIPRLSYYIGKGENEKVRQLVDRAYNFTFFLSIPAAVGLFMLSDSMILLLSGSGFSSAGKTMKIMAPIVILIPFSMATNQQTLVPMKQEKLILFSTMTGAVTNFTMNMFLIPRYAENGAAVATVLSELAVAMVCLSNANKFFNMKKVFGEFYKYCIASIPIPFIVWGIEHTDGIAYVQLLLSIILSAIAYFALMCLQKSEICIRTIRLVRDKTIQK